MTLLKIMPAKIKAKLQEKRYTAGETILYAERENDYLYFLLEGKAAAYVTNASGNIAYIYVYEGGSIFGEMEQFWEGKKPVEITALMPCSTVRLHRTDLFAWMQADFEVTKGIIRILAGKLISNCERIEEAQLLTVKERLLRCVATHIILGDISRLSKEQAVIETGAPMRSVNRAIAECARDSILRYEKKHFEIIDESSILELSDYSNLTR